MRDARVVGLSGLGKKRDDGQTQQPLCLANRAVHKHTRNLTVWNIEHLSSAMRLGPLCPLNRFPGKLHGLSRGTDEYTASSVSRTPWFYKYVFFMRGAREVGVDGVDKE